MTRAIILANAWFRVDNRQTCDHRVDVLINTMKYRNDQTLIGCIGPHISSCILSRNFSCSICILRGEVLLGSRGQRPLDPEHGGKRVKVRKHTREECYYECVEHMMKGVINDCFPPLGNPQGSIYWGG
jgi:hypothetical protein